MYANIENKRAYFKNRYENNKDAYKSAMWNYWRKKAQEMFGIENPTDEQCRQAKNEYYKQYRKNNKEKVNSIQNKFYDNWANENKEE